MADACGAKTRSGGKCRKAPIKGKTRCRLHGGNSTGAKNNKARPKSKTNAITHGIYSHVFTEEEKQFADAIRLSGLNDLLQMTKIRLRRALAVEQEKVNTLELEGSVERQGGGVTVAHDEQTFKVRDYSKLIDTLTARIQSIEKDIVAIENVKHENALKADEVRKLHEIKDETPIGTITVRVINAKP